MSKSVPDMLAELSKLYRERNKVYGHQYKNEFGRIMSILFPKGLMIITESDFNRFAIVIHIIAILTRYAAQYENGGHSDSLDDLAVYAMMLQELDLIKKELGVNEDRSGKERRASSISMHAGKRTGPDRREVDGVKSDRIGE